MHTKTALVFGVTGLTGSYLLQLLLSDSRYHKVKIFVRRTNDFISNDKLEVHIVEISRPEKYSHLLHGDDLFCCLGTTISKAGSKEAFREIDFELILKIAKSASKNIVSSFSVISSLGANSKSSNLYLRTKGEMEEAVQKFAFKKISILRPSILLGGRKDFRFGEMVGKLFIQMLGFIFICGLRKYKAIHAKDVAKAMIAIVNNDFSEIIFESDKIKTIADKC